MANQISHPHHHQKTLFKALQRIQAHIRGYLTRKKLIPIKMQGYNEFVNKNLQYFWKSHLVQQKSIQFFQTKQYPQQNTKAYISRQFIDLIETQDGSYIGQWSQGQKYGKGIQIFNNGYIFVGFWVHAKPWGFGRYITQHGLYQGLWIAGNITQGKFQSKNIIYQGYFQNNQFQGKGTLTSKYGVYNGEFKKGYKHGFALYRTDTYRFQGFFNQNQIQYGIMEAQDWSYQGFFANGKFHGKGMLRQNGVVYQGKFQKGRKQGWGIFQGNMIGQWRSGVIDGVVFFKEQERVQRWKEGVKVGRSVRQEVVFEQIEQQMNRQMVEQGLCFEQMRVGYLQII